MNIRRHLLSFSSLLLLVSFEAKAGGVLWPNNRITEDTAPSARCMGAVNDEKCETRRWSALSLGCISSSEYDILKRRGSYPICADLGEGVQLQAWCSCGCFHPEMLISVFDKTLNRYLDVGAGHVASQIDRYQAIHLDESSRVAAFNLKTSNLQFPTKGVEALPLVVIQTQDGRFLKLTDKHPVLTARGEMVQAKELRQEDGLIGQDGLPIEIASIKREEFEGEVVNFSVDSSLDRKLEHVIFAERIAVGDLAWQSSLEDELNQIILRK